jgi:hypothetical protein
MSPLHRRLPAALALAAACGLAPVVVCGLAPAAAAVILAPGDGLGNTEAPADDFGFAYVGAVEETAVYLGNGWVITANHVDEGPVALPGGVHPPVPGSKRRLQNQGPGVSPDVALFRLQEPVPPLPALPIRATAPAPGELVVLMGHGPNRGEPTEFGGHSGWRFGPGHALRWGTNRVHALHPVVQAGPGDRTVAFSTRLSSVDATEFEAGVAIGDSGGGAFIRNGTRWELAGVLIATSTYDDQPPHTLLFGNLSYVADLSHYRDQVLAIIGVPACRDGLDDDGDGLVDYPEDPGCSHADDRTELSVEPDPAASPSQGRRGLRDQAYVAFVGPLPALPSRTVFSASRRSARYWSATSAWEGESIRWMPWGSVMSPVNQPFALSWPQTEKIETAGSLEP